MFSSSFESEAKKKNPEKCDIIAKSLLNVYSNTSFYDRWRSFIGETDTNMNCTRIYRFMLFPIGEKDTTEYFENVWVPQMLTDAVHSFLRVNSLASRLQNHHQDRGETQGAGRNLDLTDFIVLDFVLTESVFI